MFKLLKLSLNRAEMATRQTTLSALYNAAQIRSVRHHVLFASSLLAAAVAAGPSVARDDDPDYGRGGPIVNTVEGTVRGYKKDGVNVFLGIPYAAPPVGDLRWRPPQPVKRWEALDATQYASNCPQVTEFGAFAGPSSVNEDCLYLNVFTTGGGRFGQKKPVIVWIHGGGNIDGESNDYDGSKLATGGPGGVPTVVVTLNYRLGLLGFLSHPALNAEGHLWGNYGTLDQQAALRWVQRNIQAFGGDPTRVALGGQSAGAQNTGANQLSPLAAGLFNRAIYQSSPGFFTAVRSAPDALAIGNAFASAAGCPGSDASAAACLRQLSAARIMQLQGTPNANGPYTSGNGALQIIVDGTIVPMQPAAAFTSGNFNRMPIMGGTTRDELTFSSGVTEYFSGPPQRAMTAAEYVASVSPAVLAQYPLSNYGGDPQLASNRVMADPVLCGALHMLKLQAAKVPVYAYDFTYRNAPYYFPKMPGFAPLAAHTIDIQFLFSRYHGGNLGVNLDQATGRPRELNANETHLSDELVAAWTNFASTGNPNGSGNSPWPMFTTPSPTFLQQDIPLSTETKKQYRTNYKCEFWDSILTYPM